MVAVAISHYIYMLVATSGLFETCQASEYEYTISTLYSDARKSRTDGKKINERKKIGLSVTEIEMMQNITFYPAVTYTIEL